MANSSFYAQEMEFLGYILTRGGVKPQPNKVYAILVLNLPNNVKEIRRFLGMVQYYRNMWSKNSEMLAPLTDLMEECGETKATKKWNQQETMEVGCYPPTSICQH